jgi:hypothetical protein
MVSDAFAEGGTDPAVPAGTGAGATTSTLSVLEAGAVVVLGVGVDSARRWTSMSLAGLVSVRNESSIIFGNGLQPHAGQPVTKSIT